MLGPAHGAAALVPAAGSVLLATRPLPPLPPHVSTDRDSARSWAAAKACYRMWCVHETPSWPHGVHEGRHGQDTKKGRSRGKHNQVEYALYLAERSIGCDVGDDYHSG